jgi:hypothetical protein
MFNSEHFFRPARIVYVTLTTVAVLAFVALGFLPSAGSTLPIPQPVVDDPRYLSVCQQDVANFGFQLLAAKENGATREQVREALREMAKKYGIDPTVLIAFGDAIYDENRTEINEEWNALVRAL